MDRADLLLILWAALGFVVTYGLLWVYQWRRQDATIVDVGWPYSLAAAVLFFGLVTDGPLAHRLLWAILPALWAARLGTHILTRRVLSKEGEDPRYRALRRHWGKHADLHFIWFFQAQGLANIFLTAPILLLMKNPQPGLSSWEIVGAVIVIASVALERVADNQLHAWKSNPQNKGITCRKGLWRYSRHPNYFFEWCHWLAYPVAGLALLDTSLAPWWPLTLLGPVLMFILLVKGTGIPFAEQQSLEHRGEDYRRYQQETHAFFPWFPRKPARPVQPS
ncbi:MAG: DUF1295 domain-containing protein [Verrucomicrobiota bacterium JB022]|nr:DUF1295 domain-containing protein [Verrucomicrobiota bacterium JB022]